MNTLEKIMYINSVVFLLLSKFFPQKSIENNRTLHFRHFILFVFAIKFSILWQLVFRLIKIKFHVD